MSMATDRGAGAQLFGVRSLRHFLLVFLCFFFCCCCQNVDARVCVEDNETAAMVASELAIRLESVNPTASWDIERFEAALVGSVEASSDVKTACVFLIVPTTNRYAASCGVRGDEEGDDVQLDAEISGPPPAWYNSTLGAFLNGTSPRTAGGGMWLDTQQRSGNTNASSTMTYTRPVTTSFPIGSNLTFNMSGGNLRWWGAIAVNVDALSYLSTAHAIAPTLVACPAGESAEMAEGDGVGEDLGHCVPCPYPTRCQGTLSGQRNCSHGTSGPLCLEIDGEHFAFGTSVLECPALPYQAIIGCSIAAFVVLLAAIYARRGKLFPLYMKYQVNVRIWINFTQLVLAHLPLVVLPGDADLLAHGAQGVNSVAPFALSGLKCMAGQFRWRQKFFGVTGAFFLVHATLLAIDRYHDRNFRTIVRRGSSVREEERSIAARALTRQLWVVLAQLLLSYWINVTMESITCVDVSGGLGDEDLRLFYEPSLTCFETTHVLMLCWGLAVALFFFGLIGAVTFALVDVKRKHGYYAARNRKQLGALYTSYTKGFMLFGLASYWRRMISLALCRHDYQAGQASSWYDAAMTIVYFFYVHFNSPCIGHCVAVPLLPGFRTFDLYNSLEKVTTVAVFAIQALICLQVSSWWQPTKASFAVVLVLVAVSAAAIWSPWRALDTMLAGAASTPRRTSLSALSAKRLKATRRAVTDSVREGIRSGRIYSGDDSDADSSDTEREHDGSNRANDAPLSTGRNAPRPLRRSGRQGSSGSFSEKALSLHQQLMEQRDKFFLACKLGQYDLAREEREVVLRLNGTITEDLERREQRALDKLDTEKAVEIHELRSELMITNARHVPLKALKTQLEHQLRREEQASVDAFARLDVRCLKMYLGRFRTEVVNHADLFSALKHRHDLAFDLATQQLFQTIYAKSLDEALAMEGRIKKLVQAYANDLQALLSWAVDALSPDDLPRIRAELKGVAAGMHSRFGISTEDAPTTMCAASMSKLGFVETNVRSRVIRLSARNKRTLNDKRDAKRNAFEARWQTMLQGASLELIPKIRESYRSAVECVAEVMSRGKLFRRKKKLEQWKGVTQLSVKSVRRKILESVARSGPRGAGGVDLSTGPVARLMRNGKMCAHMDNLEHCGNILMAQSTELLTEIIAGGFLREAIQLWVDLESRIMSCQRAIPANTVLLSIPDDKASTSAAKARWRAISMSKTSIASAGLPDSLVKLGGAVPFVVHAPASRKQNIEYLSTRNEIEKLLHEDDDPWAAHGLNDASNEQLDLMRGAWEREAQSIMLSDRVGLDAAHQVLLYAQCIKQMRSHWDARKTWRRSR